MKTLRLILCIIALILMSCSGHQDETIYDLTVRTDRSEIVADGISTVTLTATYGSEDVTGSEAITFNITGSNGKSSALTGGVNVFSTSEPGEYEISASYNTGTRTVYSKESQKVKAVQAELSAKSGYKQMQLAMCFTSIYCQYCPILHEAVGQIMESNPGEIIPIALHLNSLGSDPLAENLPLNEKFFKRLNTGEEEGLPLFSLNLRKSSQHITNEKIKILAEIEKQAKEYPAMCGIAINSKYDQASDAIKVEARFKTDVAGYYNYHIFIVQDGIIMEQNGEQSYAHDHVLRYVTADNIFGTKINQGKILESGNEYEVSKSIKLDNSGKISDMRVIVSMLYSSDGGSTFVCNNTAECPATGSIDYIFEK